MERNNKSLQVYFRCKYCHQTFITPENLINHKLATHAAEVLTIRPEAAVFAASAVEQPLCDPPESHADDAQCHKSEDNADYDYKSSCKFSETANDIVEKEESDTERQPEKRTQETPFSCMYCFKSFSQCSALSSHMIQCESSWVDENVLTNQTGDDLTFNSTQKKISRKRGPSPPTTGSITATVRNQNVSKWILQNSLVNETISNAGTRVDSEHDHGKRQEGSFFQTIGVESECGQFNIFQEGRSEMKKARGWEHQTRYRCKYCDKSSIHRIYMLNHEKAHTLERLFKCSRCSNNYIRSSHLSRHQLKCKGRTMQPILRRMELNSTWPSENVNDKNEDANAMDQKEEHSTRRHLSANSQDYQIEIQNARKSVGEKTSPVHCQLYNKRFLNRFVAANHHKFHSDSQLEQSSCDVARVSNKRCATVSHASSSAVMELDAEATLGHGISTKYKPAPTGNHPTNSSPKMANTQQYPSSIPKSLQLRESQIKSENQAQLAKNIRVSKYAEDSWYPHIKRCYSREGCLFYSCKFCGKTRGNRADAVRHTVTHLGPDVHFCPRCPEKFPKRDLLVSHLAVHKK